jgi:hypothetical protein
MRMLVGLLSSAWNSCGCCCKPPRPPIVEAEAADIEAVGADCDERGGEASVAVVVVVAVGVARSISFLTGLTGFLLMVDVPAMAVGLVFVIVGGGYVDCREAEVRSEGVDVEAAAAEADADAYGEREDEVTGFETAAACRVSANRVSACVRGDWDMLLPAVVEKAGISARCLKRSTVGLGFEPGGPGEGTRLSSRRFRTLLWIVAARSGFLDDGVEEEGVGTGFGFLFAIRRL